MAFKPGLVLENSILKVRNDEVTKNEVKTYLATASASGASTLTVQNITGFGVNDYILLGKFGSDEAEIIKLHASTAPSGTTITLASTTARAYSRDTVIQRIGFNQVEFSRASTTGGAKTVLTTKNITSDEIHTIYNDTTNSTGFGYVRFYNSTAATNSSYSDEEKYPYWKQDAVGRVIDSVYSRANEVDEGFVSRKEVLRFVQDFIDDVNDRKKRWRHEEAPVDKSNITTLGGEVLDLPTDIKYKGNESIDVVNIEGEMPLIYIGQDEWTKKLVKMARTTLNGNVSAGATSITVYDTTNFGDSGTGYIDGDAFAWTGKTATTLTGVTGILAHSDGDVVWQDSDLGTPTYYTILDGTGRLFPAPDGDYDGRPLVITYTERLDYPDSENDSLPIPYLSACKEYCLMCIEDKKGKDGSNMSQKYERRYERKIETVVRQEKTGQPRAFVNRSR